MHTSKFSLIDYLDSKEMMAEYLTTVLDEGDKADVINAIGNCKSHRWGNIIRRNRTKQNKFIQGSF